MTNTNSNRRKGRENLHSLRQPGDLNRKSTREMRTHDGMCKGENAKLTVNQTYHKMLFGGSNRYATRAQIIASKKGKKK